MACNRPGDYSSLPPMNSYSRRVSWCGHVRGGSSSAGTIIDNDSSMVVRRPSSQHGRRGVSNMVKSATTRLSVIWATPAATEMDIPPLSSFIWNRVPIVYSGTLYYLERRGILGTDGKWKKRLCFLDEARLYVFEVPATAAEASVAIGQPPGEPDEVSISSTATNSKGQSGASNKKGWAIDLEDYEFRIEEAPSAKNSPNMPQAFIFSSKGMKNDTQCLSAASAAEHDEWSSKLQSVLGELKKRNAVPNKASNSPGEASSSSLERGSPEAGRDSCSAAPNKDAENASFQGATAGKTYGKNKVTRTAVLAPTSSGAVGAKVKVKKQSKLAAAVAGFGQKQKEAKVSNSRQGPAGAASAVGDERCSDKGSDRKQQQGSSVSGDPSGGAGCSTTTASEPWDSLTWETPLAGESEFSDRVRGAYCYTSSDDDGEEGDKFGTDEEDEGDSALSSFATISEGHVVGGKSYTVGGVKGAVGGGGSKVSGRGALRTRRGRRDTAGVLLQGGTTSPGSFLRKASKQSRRFMANRFSRAQVDSHVYDAPVVRTERPKPNKDSKSNDTKKRESNKPSVSPQPEDSFYQAPKPILKPSAAGGPSKLNRFEDLGFSSSISSTIDLMPSAITTTAGAKQYRNSLGIHLSAFGAGSDLFGSFSGRSRTSNRQPQHTPPEYATLESSFRNAGKAKRNPLGGEVFFATAKSKSQENLAAYSAGATDDTFLAPDASLAHVVNFINLLVTEVARVHHKLDKHGTVLISLEADVRRNTKDLGSLQENITLVAQSTREALEAQKLQLEQQQQQQQTAASDQKGEKQTFNDLISSGAKACDAANKEAQATLEEARNIASELKGAREEFNLAKIRLEEMTKIISRFTTDQSMNNNNNNNIKNPTHHSQQFHHHHQPTDPALLNNNRRATLPRRGSTGNSDRRDGQHPGLDSVDESPDNSNVYANSCEAIKSAVLSSGSHRDPDEIQLMSTSTPSVCCPAASTAVTEEDDDTYDVPSNFVKPVATSTSRSTVCSSSSSARSSAAGLMAADRQVLISSNKEDNKGDLLRQPSWETRDYATLTEIQQATAARNRQKEMANNSSNKADDGKNADQHYQQSQSPQKSGFLANAHKLFWSSSASSSTSTPNPKVNKDGKKKRMLLASRRHATPALPPRNNPPSLVGSASSISAGNTTNMTSAWSFGSNNSLNHEDGDDSNEIYAPISEEGFELSRVPSP